MLDIITLVSCFVSVTLLLLVLSMVVVYIIQVGSDFQYRSANRSIRDHPKWRLPRWPVHEKTSETEDNTHFLYMTISREESSLILTSDNSVVYTVQGWKQRRIQTLYRRTFTIRQVNRPISRRGRLKRQRFHQKLQVRNIFRQRLSSVRNRQTRHIQRQRDRNEFQLNGRAISIPHQRQRGKNRFPQSLSVVRNRHCQRQSDRDIFRYGKDNRPNPDNRQRGKRNQPNPRQVLHKSSIQLNTGQGQHGGRIPPNSIQRHPNSRILSNPRHHGSRIRRNPNKRKRGGTVRANLRYTLHGSMKVKRAVVVTRHHIQQRKTQQMPSWYAKRLQLREEHRRLRRLRQQQQRARQGNSNHRRPHSKPKPKPKQPKKNMSPRDRYFDNLKRNMNGIVVRGPKRGGSKFVKTTDTVAGHRFIRITCEVTRLVGIHTKYIGTVIDIKQIGKSTFTPIVSVDKHGKIYWSKEINWKKKFANGKKDTFALKMSRIGIKGISLVLPGEDCRKERGEYRCYQYEKSFNRISRIDNHLYLYDVQCNYRPPRVVKKVRKTIPRRQRPPKKKARRKPARKKSPVRRKPTHRRSRKYSNKKSSLLAYFQMLQRSAGSNVLKVKTGLKFRGDQGEHNGRAYTELHCENSLKGSYQYMGIIIEKQTPNWHYEKIIGASNKGQIVWFSDVTSIRKLEGTHKKAYKTTTDKKGIKKLMLVVPNERCKRGKYKCISYIKNNRGKFQLVENSNLKCGTVKRKKTTKQRTTAVKKKVKIQKAKKKQKSTKKIKNAKEKSKSRDKIQNAKEKSKAKVKIQNAKEKSKAKVKIQNAKEKSKAKVKIQNAKEKSKSTVKIQNPTEKQKSTDTRIVAVGIVGICLLIVLLTAVVVFYLIWSKKQKETQTDDNEDEVEHSNQQPNDQAQNEPYHQQNDLENAPYHQQNDLENAPYHQQNDLENAPYHQQNDLENAPYHQQNDPENAPYHQQNDPENAPYHPPTRGRPPRGRPPRGRPPRGRPPRGRPTRGRPPRGRPPNDRGRPHPGPHSRRPLDQNWADQTGPEQIDGNAAKSFLQVIPRDNVEKLRQALQKRIIMKKVFPTHIR